MGLEPLDGGRVLRPGVIEAGEANLRQNEPLDDIAADHGDDHALVHRPRQGELRPEAEGRAHLEALKQALLDEFAGTQIPSFTKLWSQQITYFSPARPRSFENRVALGEFELILQFDHNP